MVEVTNTSGSPFFYNSHVFNPHQKLNATELLEFIKSNSPITIWDICKKLELNRNTVYFMLRDFEFAGLIYSHVSKNKSNRYVRTIYYNKKQSKKAEATLPEPEIDGRAKR